MRLTPVTLQGLVVRLEPLDPKHFEEVVAAAVSHPEIWRHIPYRVRERADVERIFGNAAQMREAGTGAFFATCVGAEGRVVGGTAIRLVDPATPSVEVGSTWIVPAHQRTRVNTEAKYLQLLHCFETLDVARVELKTDALNSRSQAAIRRIGATEEGTFRRHMRRQDGTLRDSVFFSIVAEEWPSVKERLEAKLRAPA